MSPQPNLSERCGPLVTLLLADGPSCDDADDRLGMAWSEQGPRNPDGPLPLARERMDESYETLAEELRRLNVF
jgi:hypothetical protein